MHGLSLGGTWRRTQAWQGLGSVLSPQAGPWLSQAPAAASPRLVHQTHLSRLSTRWPHHYSDAVFSPA